MSEKYDVSIPDLKSRSRLRRFSKVRQMYCYLARMLWMKSEFISIKKYVTTTTIGSHINRSYSVVIKAIRTVQQDMKTDHELSQDVKELLDCIELKHSSYIDERTPSPSEDKRKLRISLVRRIILLHRHYKWREIAKILNEQDIRTSQGKLWSTDRVRQFVMVRPKKK